MSDLKKVKELLKNHKFGSDHEEKLKILNLMIKLPLRDTPELLELVPKEYRPQWYDDMMTLGVGALMKRRPK